MGKLKFRPSTLNERNKFYEKEFSIKKIKKWFRKNKMPLPQICAVDAGSESGIIINKKLKNQMLYCKFSELKDKIKKYVPEDVYYDRNNYKNPNKILKTLNFKKHISQELMFDIDFDNINKKRTKVDDKTITKAYNWALKLKNELKKQFDKVEIVYSGRGFHVYVHNKSARFLNNKERNNLIKKYSKYPIDPWVSRGYIRLARMPYSLNSLVSRKVIPVNNKFNKDKTIPKFLKSQ